MRQTLALLAWMLVAATGQAQTVSMAGYAKSLGISSRLPSDGEAFVLNINRFRAESKLSLTQRVRLEAWLDSEVLTGSFLRTAQFEASQRTDTSKGIDWDWTIVRSQSLVVRQRLFRAFTIIDAGRIVWTIGRQRIVWGTGFAWNPTDLLNPFDPGAIELSERGGIDAIHGSIALGPLSRLEIVAAASDRSGDYQYAVRTGANLRQYDVNIVGGFFGRRKALGGDFAGYVGGAGIRGELAWVSPDAGPDYVRAVLNADYTIQPGIYVLSEVYYNGRQSAGLGEAFGTGPWYGAFTAAAPVTPLLGITAYGLVNLSDGSALCGPAITLSLAQALELQAAAYVFAGRSSSEFGRQPHAVFAALQWYY